MLLLRTTGQANRVLAASWIPRVANGTQEELARALFATAKRFERLSRRVTYLCT
jgi:hypothetical protein